MSAGVTGVGSGVWWGGIMELQVLSLQPGGESQLPPPVSVYVCVYLACIMHEASAAE